VVERPDFLPCRRRVAGGTVHTQAPFVDVLMTSTARRIQPQIGAVVGVLGSPEFEGRDPVLGAVTGFATRRGVRPVEQVSGPVVLKALASGVTPVDQVEGPARVFGMAIGTVGAPLACVETTVEFERPREVLVALEALRVESIVASRMTVPAMPHAFEMGVRIAEWPG